MLQTNSEQHCVRLERVCKLGGLAPLLVGWEGWAPTSLVQNPPAEDNAAVLQSRTLRIYQYDVVGLQVLSVTMLSTTNF